MPRRSSLRRARPRPGCQSQESPVGAAPVLLRLPSQPVTTALSTQVLFSSQNCAGCCCCFSKVKTSGVFNLPFLFVLPVIFLSPELSCSPAESSSQLKTLAPHLYSPSPLSSRAGSEPPPSSPPSALPAPAPATSSLSPPSPPPPTSNASSQDASLSAESEEEKAKKLLYCSLCKVAVNSLSQLEAHNAGKELFLEESFREFLMYNLS